MTDQSSYTDLPLSRFLEQLAGPDPAPSGGGAAALTVSLGAALCAMTARLSGRHLGDAEAADLAAGAQRLADAAASLIQADADSYQAVIAARRQSAGLDQDARDREMAAALRGAAAVPMEIVELAVPVAGIAARLAAAGNPNLRGDAIAGALLAEAGARAAAALVWINLAVAPDDDRPARAARLVAETASIAAAAQGSSGQLRLP